MKSTAVLAAALAVISCSFVKVSVKNQAKFSGETVKAEGGMVTKEFDVTEFNSVTCNIPAEIQFRTGEPSVRISCPESIAEILNVSISSEEHLTISFDKKVRDLEKDGMKIYLSSKTLELLTTNGASEFRIDSLYTENLTITVNGVSKGEINGLKCDNFTITVNGSGEGEIEGLDCKSLKATINGAGELTVKGRGDNASVRINGAGEVDLKEFDCPDILPKVAGAGVINYRN